MLADSIVPLFVRFVLLSSTFWFEPIYPRLFTKALFAMGAVALMASCAKSSDVFDQGAVDAQKKAAIYKFVNDQSHITGSGFDPALVPEAQKNIGYLLELMQTTFPEHYSILEESLS